MPDALGSALEVFSAPLETVIAGIAQGVSSAQRALDLNSLATQNAIDADPSLAGFGVQATWYQFPRVDVQLKVSLTVAESSDETVRPHLFFSPVSAAFQNHFDYTADAATTVSFSIVPVPPPNAAVAESSARLSQQEAIALALAAPGVKFATVADPQLGTVPSPALRFAANYSGSSRSWYVIQSDPNDTTKTAAIVVVDDQTKTVRVVSSPS